MSRLSSAEARLVMSSLEDKLRVRSKLELEIIQLQNQFAAFEKDPRIAAQYRGCGTGPKYYKATTKKKK
jgi:hypothetical protein